MDLSKIVKALSVSAVVSSSLPVLVERTMYRGSLSKSGAVAAGSYGRTTLFPYYEFPSGDTSAGNSEFLLLLNPGSAPVTVHAQFFPALGASVSASYTVAAHSRTTIDVGRDVAGLPPGPNGVVVSSADGITPFVAEQSLYQSGFSSESTAARGSAYRSGTTGRRLTVGLSNSGRHR